MVNLHTCTIAGTVRLDQWINGCIELQAGSVEISRFYWAPEQSDFVLPGVYVWVKLTRLYAHCVLMLVGFNWNKRTQGWIPWKFSDRYLWPSDYESYWFRGSPDFVFCAKTRGVGGNVLRLGAQSGVNMPPQFMAPHSLFLIFYDSY